MFETFDDTATVIPTPDRTRSPMAGYFHLNSSATGKFSFSLKAGNHEVILTSQIYANKADALAGIESVRKNAPAAARYERKTAKDKSAYFVLLAENGKTLGRSEMYSSTSAMENGIASVMTNGVSTFVKGLE
jgi:uncharacterized protein YegP (UPF0339 family)